MLEETYSEIQQSIYEEIDNQLDTAAIWNEVLEEFNDDLNERYHELLNERREEAFTESLHEWLAS